MPYLSNTRGLAEATRRLIDGEREDLVLQAETPKLIRAVELPYNTTKPPGWIIGRAAQILGYEEIEVYSPDGRLLLAGRRGDPPEKWKYQAEHL
jgi:hypothetical protein